MKQFVSVLLVLFGLTGGIHAETARGVVFVDANNNKQFDAGEKPLAGVGVSNGKDIVRTDAEGKYSLEIDDDSIVFVIKPTGYRTPIDPEQMLPRFYYIHKPAGSPKGFRYAGVEPTGPLPSSIDFPLYPQEEPRKFKAIMFGDPQPRDEKEVDYIAKDVIPGLVGTDAKFGVTLGDIAFDKLYTLESLNKKIAVIGIPWHNVIGNHDLNFHSDNDKYSDETFERIYGPSYYSFDYGPVHFVALDDVDWHIKNKETNRKGYVAGLGADQLKFVENTFAYAPPEKLVVLMMHIPLDNPWREDERQALYRLMETRELCVSISAHNHVHRHRFLTEADGWKGKQPHHHIVNVTVSGSWWTGAPDERGIPHALMRDGAPNGWSEMTFDGAEYKLEFRAARRPADYQMNIYCPDEVEAGSATNVVVNVFNGSERCETKMRVGDGDWIPMEFAPMYDPDLALINKAEAEAKHKLGYRKANGAIPSTHTWRAPLPKELKPGHHMIEVRTKNLFGDEYAEYRVLEIK